MNKELMEAVKKYYKDMIDDEYGRYRSWEHCYYNFYKARKEKCVDKDYLSLQLAFYLASWGMYRGSSYLLQQDYKVHIPVVRLLLNAEYDNLCGISCNDLLQEKNRTTLWNLSKAITEYYEKVRYKVKGDVKSEVSETLISKILMGTLGCVPAYDSYFIKAIKKKNVGQGKYSEKSIDQLAKFYQNNEYEFEKMRKDMWVNDVQYPQMKLLDMGFWQIGQQI